MEFPDELTESLFHADDHQVLGRRLAPLSLKHLAALFAVKSPLVSTEAEEALEFSDLVIATGICAARDDDELNAFMCGMGSDRERAIAQLAGVDYANQEAEQFDRWKEYWADYFSPVATLPGAGKKRNLQMHWILNLVCRLMRYGHFTEEAAWWTCPGAAFHYQLTFKEIAGEDFEVLTPKTRAEYKEMGWTDSELDGGEGAD